MMRHELFSTVDTMLSADVLAALTGQSIAAVRQSPFPIALGASGSRLFTIETNDGQGPRFVLKLVLAESDWVMRATNDQHGRETLLWQRGIIDRLPAEIARIVVACAKDGPGWAILMRDVSTALLPASSWNIADTQQLLEALAALHATFWDDAEAFTPAAGFCSLWHYYTSLSPVTASRETKGSDDYPSLVARGWALLDTVVEPDVAALARRLIESPQPLVQALEKFPQTLVHRDMNLGNLGLLRERPTQTALLDWQYAGAAPPGVDLAGFLSEFSAWLPVTKEEVIQAYHDRLARRLGPRFAESWWQPQLELALLGDFVRLAWAYAYHLTHDESRDRQARYQKELAWWSAQARIATRWL